MLIIELFCSLHCLVISTLWFPQLSKLISFVVHQLFGPHKLLWSAAHVRRVRRFCGLGNRQIIGKIIYNKKLNLEIIGNCITFDPKMALYCPQGSGTLRQQLTILHILHIPHVLHILHILHILHYIALSWTILDYLGLS